MIPAQIELAQWIQEANLATLEWKSQLAKVDLLETQAAELCRKIGVYQNQLEVAPCWEDKAHGAIERCEKRLRDVQAKTMLALRNADTARTKEREAREKVFIYQQRIAGEASPLEGNGALDGEETGSAAAENAARADGAMTDFESLPSPHTIVRSAHGLPDGRDRREVYLARGGDRDGQTASLPPLRRDGERSANSCDCADGWTMALSGAGAR